MDKSERKMLDKAATAISEARVAISEIAQAENDAFEDLSERAQEGKKGQRLANNASELFGLADELEEIEHAIADILANEKGS